MKQLARVVLGARIAAIEVARVVADVVRELRHHLRRQDLPRTRLRTLDRFDNKCDRSIAEDEVAVAFAPVHVTGRELGDHDECALRGAGLDRLLRHDRGAGRGGATDRDVEAIALLRADRMLDLDRDRRIQALQVRRAEHDEIDVLADTPGLVERDHRGILRVLGLVAQLILGTARNVRAHSLGIHQAGLVLDIALLDARRLVDVLAARFFERLADARGDVGFVLRVVTAHELVEAGDELVIRQDRCWMPDPVARDRNSGGRP